MATSEWPNSCSKTQKNSATTTPTVTSASEKLPESPKARYPKKASSRKKVQWTFTSIPKARPILKDPPIALSLPHAPAGDVSALQLVTLLGAPLCAEVDKAPHGLHRSLDECGNFSGGHLLTCCTSPLPARIEGWRNAPRTTVSLRPRKTLPPSRRLCKARKPSAWTSRPRPSLPATETCACSSSPPRRRHSS